MTLGQIYAIKLQMQSILSLSWSQSGTRVVQHPVCPVKPSSGFAYAAIMPRFRPAFGLCGLQRSLRAQPFLLPCFGRLRRSPKAQELGSFQFSLGSRWNQAPGAQLMLSHCKWQPAHGTRAARGWTKPPWKCFRSSAPAVVLCVSSPTGQHSTFSERPV